MSGQRWDHWAPEPPEDRPEDVDPNPRLERSGIWWQRAGSCVTADGEQLVVLSFGWPE